MVGLPATGQLRNNNTRSREVNILPASMLWQPASALRQFFLLRLFAFIGWNVDEFDVKHQC